MRLRHNRSRTAIHGHAFFERCVGSSASRGSGQRIRKEDRGRQLICPLNEAAVNLPRSCGGISDGTARVPCSTQLRGRLRAACWSRHRISRALHSMTRSKHRHVAVPLRQILWRLTTRPRGTLPRELTARGECTLTRSPRQPDPAAKSER
jgi:hypothetical protein